MAAPDAGGRDPRIGSTEAHVMSGELLAGATEFLYREAAALDARDWEAWLELFDADAEYWVPAWKSEDEQTSDPARELSLIYYADRAGLQERVWRVSTRRSLASAVLPRTLHGIHNVTLLEGSTAELLRVGCGWTVHQFLPKEGITEIFFGRYEQTLAARKGGWRISRKKIVLLNDRLPAKLDFYNI